MLWIKAEVSPGTSIHNAVIETIEASGRLGVGIELKFNGEMLLIDGTKKPDLIVNRYFMMTERRSKKGG